MKSRLLLLLICAQSLIHATPLKLDLHCELPAPQQSIQDATLIARLYEYDPRLADVAAKEVDRITLNGIDLSTEQATHMRFPLSAKRTPQHAYYVTIFLHPDPLSEQRLYFINGFQKAFQGADSETLTLTLTQRTN